MTDSAESQKRSLFKLIGELPGLVSDLLRAEIDAIKADLKSRAIRAGVGAALMVVGAFIALCAVAVGIFAAIAGIATALPWWASALIVFGGLLIIALIIFFAGIGAFKSMNSGSPLARVTEDVQALAPAARRAARGDAEGSP